jgi:DNA gyrase/topoisomerase IV subunit A
MVKAKLYLAKSGKLVRFEETKTRPMGRTASGVRGITLKMTMMK